MKATVARAALFVLMIAVMALPGTAVADTNTSLIEAPQYPIGTIDNIQGWSSFGAANNGGCAVYDHQVTALSTLGISSPAYNNAFGSRALRISNSVVSGCFGDQTYSPSTSNEAGETSAESGGRSGGERQSRYIGSFNIASAVPGAQQPGLSVTVSPDRGDGARMGYLRFDDTAAGIDVSWRDYDKDTQTFPSHPIATLDRSVPHRVTMDIQFLDGVSNDVVTLKIDGNDVTPSGGITTWEDYSRDVGSEPATVDSMLFRTAVAASTPAEASALAGFGFLIDNVSGTTPAVAASGPTGATGSAGDTGPSGPAGAEGEDEGSQTSSSLSLGAAKIKRSGRAIIVPVVCRTVGVTACTGTIDVRIGSKLVAVKAFSALPGKSTIRVTLPGKAKYNVKMRVILRNYSPSGKTSSQQRIQRVR